MLRPADRLLLRDLATVTAFVTVGAWLWRAVGLARTWPAGAMSDGLPLYLTASTVRRGADPTDAAELARTYAEAGLDAQAHMFSTLYPASTPALLGPLVPGDFPAFAAGWQLALLLAAVVAGATGAASGARPDRRLLAAGLGAVVTTILFPTAVDCARLGQINQLLAALAGCAQLAVALGAAGVGAGLLVVGGGLKLVPLFATWPLFAGLRWRALGVALAVGLGVVALTAWHVPLDRAVDGVLHTLRFQSGTSTLATAGLTPRDPAWLLLLVGVRHWPLAVLTVLVAGLAAFRARADGRPAPLVGGVALVFAWLGADAASQHALYLPLVLASVGWVVTWPLADCAPRGSFVATGLLLAGLYALHTTSLPDQASSVFFGELVWALAAARVLTETPLRRLDHAVLVGALVLSVANEARRIPGLGASGPPAIGAPPGGVTPTPRGEQDRRRPVLPPSGE